MPWGMVTILQRKSEPLLIIVTALSILSYFIGSRPKLFKWITAPNPYLDRNMFVQQFLSPVCREQQWSLTCNPLNTVNHNPSLNFLHSYSTFYVNSFGIIKRLQCLRVWNFSFLHCRLSVRIIKHSSPFFQKD